MKKPLALLVSSASCLLALAACTPPAPPAPPASPAPRSDPSEPAPLIEPPPASLLPDPAATDSAPTDTASYGDDRSSILLIGPIAEDLEDCGSFDTQTEMNLCAKRNADASGEQLAQIRSLVADALDEAGKTSLARSRTAWEAFRALDCRFASSQFAGGSIEPLIYGDCLSNRNLDRIQELRGEAQPGLSYTEADQQLNADYQALRAVLGTQRQEALTDVQLAWIEYRDRNCAYEANYSPTHTITENQCLARMSKARALELQQALRQNSL